MELCGFIDARDDFLTEDSTNIIRGVGLAVFLVDFVGNVLVFHLVNLQVQNVALGFI